MNDTVYYGYHEIRFTPNGVYIFDRRFETNKDTSVRVRDLTSAKKLIKEREGGDWLKGA